MGGGPGSGPRGCSGSDAPAIDAAPPSPDASTPIPNRDIDIEFPAVYADFLKGLKSDPSMEIDDVNLSGALDQIAELLKKVITDP